MDMNRLRRIAGLTESKKETRTPLTEMYDEDDEDMSSAERELAAKADKDLKKKGVKIAKVDPDKDIESAAKKEAADAKTAKAEEPKAVEEKPASSEETKTAEAKRRGKAPNPESKMQKALAWVIANPHAKRGEFIKHAESFAMSPNYASAHFYAIKAKLKAKTDVTECFFLTHPQSSNFMLAENREMNQYQWIDHSSDLEPLVFMSEADARKMMMTIHDFKRQGAVLTKFDMSK